MQKYLQQPNLKVLFNNLQEDILNKKILKYLKKTFLMSYSNLKYSATNHYFPDAM